MLNDMVIAQTTQMTPAVATPSHAIPQLAPVPVAKTWSYVPVPPKAAATVVAPLFAQPLALTAFAGHSTTKFGERPAWSHIVATSFESTAAAPLPTLVVRRNFTLLPEARHALDIQEDDTGPVSYALRTGRRFF